MDATNITLCKLLLSNSRSSYHELADKLGLSVNAVHKRVQELRSAGVIQNFIARPSLLATRGLNIYVSGISRSCFVQDLRGKLEKDGRTYWLGLASGNFTYIGADLRSFNELDSYVAYIRKEAKIEEPTVGILFAPFSSEDKGLYPLDYQIIRALSKDARRQISDVALDLGISAKTIRRRLARMTDLGLIELTMEFYPDKSNDILTIFNMKVNEGVDKNSVPSLLMSKYPIQTLYTLGFINLPNSIMHMVWTNSMRNLLDHYESLRGLGIFESITPNILYTGYVFHNWREAMTENAILSTKKGR